MPLPITFIHILLPYCKQHWQPAFTIIKQKSFY